MQIGFIGTGIMGSQMARHLVEAGHAVVVHNRTAQKAQPLVETGATWADSPAVVAAQVDILFTMLAHPEAVEASALGKEGFLDTLRSDTLWVDCSTVHPSFTRRMAAEANARNVRYMDAPVAGSKPQATAAKLVFIVGGEAADVETCQSYFEVMGSKVIHVGEAGMGTALKVVVNFMLGTSMAAFAEGAALGQALGLSQETLFNVLIGGPVVPPYLAFKQATMESGDYEAEFPLQWMQKDMHMAAVAAHEAGAALPLGNSVKEVFRLAMQQGLGEQDFSAIYQFFEARV